MRRRVAEVAALVAAALVITLIIAAPVLRAPNERLFGMAIVGRHRDPFTVIAQFGRPIAMNVSVQPLTDFTGALAARLVTPVAAYNYLVLLSFPLSAAAAYLLARHLALSGTGAAVAALAYAFSPFHLAHSAYHPHIAQTQWIPLYLLALWRCLDNPSPGAVLLLALSAVAVTLSNFYGGLIAAVMTPVAVVAYWLLTSRQPRSAAVRRLVITSGSLLGIAAAGIAYVNYAASPVLTSRSTFAYPFGDLFRYSTTWWGYLVPPVGNPLLGAAARRIWTAAGVEAGLLEHQVSLGLGILGLGLVAVYAWTIRNRQQASLERVPLVVIVAVAALVCSLSPQRTVGEITFYRPAALLYPVVPMFRAYARFGVVVQLMAALLAGIGVEYLLRVATRPARTLGLMLTVAAAGEYAVFPATMWRDVLPTTAHRWVMQQPDRLQVLDCTPFDEESDSVQWLTGNRIKMMSALADSCTEPNLAGKLAATGFTHVLVRRDSPEEQRFTGRQPDHGFDLVASFRDAQIFGVTAGKPAIYTASMRGLFRREQDAEWTWRWMENQAAWTVVSTRAEPAVGHSPARTGGVSPAADDEREARRHRRGNPDRVDRPGVPSDRSLTVGPGAHELVFVAVEPPARAEDVLNDGDRRRLSFAIGPVGLDPCARGAMKGPSAYRDFWAGVGERFPDLAGAASTRY